MTTRHLLRGWIDAQGSIHPQPIIIDLDEQGRVIAHQPLTGHEPSATTLLPGLLHIPSGSILHTS